MISRTEDETSRFSIETGLLVLEREAQYRAGQLTPPGLFVYQFEALSRNRLGYNDGLTAMAGDPFYDADWKEYLDLVRRQGGTVDFADLVYLRSELYVRDQQRQNPDYRAAGAAAVRRKGGQDRQGQPRPRPALPLRGPATATRLPRGAPTPSRATTSAPGSRCSRRSSGRWRCA